MITCGTLAGAIIPELVKVFTSHRSRHVREVVTQLAGRRRLAQHPVRPRGRQLLRLLARHHDHVLMAVAYGVSTLACGELMKAPAIFAFGLVAFGFLGMGPVTIAVDSYGPVTDNAQSVYELSTIEQIPGIEAEIKQRLRFRRRTSRWPRSCWRRTTGRGTPSRRRPSRC